MIFVVVVGVLQERVQPSQNKRKDPSPDSRKANTGGGARRGDKKKQEEEEEEVEGLETKGNGKAPPTSGAKAKKAAPKSSGKQSSMMSFFKKA